MYIERRYVETKKKLFARDKWVLQDLMAKNYYSQASFLYCTFGSKMYAKLRAVPG